MIAKILVPTDGSAQANKALDYAIELAKRFSPAPTVVLMNAYEPLRSRKRGASLVKQVNASLEKDARDIVTAAAKRVKAAKLGMSAVVVEGDTADAILKAIETEKPDLIVIGSAGEPTIANRLLGSVVDDVVRYSAMNVLVVK